MCRHLQLLQTPENSVCFAILPIRRLTNFYDFRFKWTATAGIGIHPSKAWLSQLVNFKNATWTLEERYAIKFCFKLWKKCHTMKAGTTAMTQRAREFPVKACWPDRANPPTNFWWSLFLTALAWSTCTGLALDWHSTKNIMLTFNVVFSN